MDPATIALLLQAAPAVVNTIGTIFGRNKQPQYPQMEPSMTWEQALQMAEAQMNPLAQQYDHQAMQRGFYGQMPNDVMRSDYLASQQAGMAQQMMQQDWQNKYNQQQAAADWSLKQGSLNLGQQQQNLQTGGMLANTYFNAAEHMGMFPWTKMNTAATNRNIAQTLAGQAPDYDLTIFNDPYGSTARRGAYYNGTTY